MSMNFFNVSDTLQVWDNVKDSVKASIAITKNRDTRDLDYSFITPTLLALGKFAEPKIDELLEVLQGKPVIIWNLSGKSLTVDGTAKLRNQIIDAPWVTPGQFTQAPSLDCIFSQCYSIKSWLDLRNDHVAIVHCSNGRSRSGILIACLLKYIGAFTHASQAFDFFCSARVLCDVKPILAPSYRILFENVDKTVDSGGYPNRHPVHLKCLAISGLPVDEIPCVEVWDMHGLVFNSHAGWKSTSRCTWSSEYGDGFFRVSHDILGDFSVMCRFGGHHAMVRDKTTLIFKYQNNTAFLPCEVVELKRQNVDINPEYSDSLDSELFTVHLMFEKPTAETAQQALTEAQRVGSEHSNSSAATVQYSAEGDFGRSNSVLPTYVAYSSINGGQAFDRGLEEISKYHFLEPEPQKITALTDMGYPEKFATSALRLANNNLDSAAVLVQNMTARASDLEKGVTEVHSSSGSTPFSPPSSLSYNATGQAVMAGQTQKNTADTGYPRDTLESDAVDPVYSPRGDDQKNENGVEEVVIREPVSPICQECGKDDPLKLDQIIVCTNCSAHVHTTCEGLRRIPFTLKTDKERQNRMKYIQKHYSQFMCKECRGSSQTRSRSNSRGSATGVSGHGPSRGPAGQPAAKPTKQIPSSSSSYRPSSSSSSSSGPQQSSASPDNSGAGAGANWMSPSQHTRSVQPHPQSPVPAHVQTKHDQAAALMGLLAASGLTMDSLFAMGEEKQREALIAAATIHNSTRVPDSSVGASKSSSTTNTDKDDSSPSESDTPSDSLPPPPKPAPVDPRKAMMEMIAKRAKAAAGDTGTADPAPEASRAETPPPPGGVKLREDPKYSKYFKMIKVGLPKPAVAQKMLAEGVVTSLDAGLELLSLNPDSIVPAGAAPPAPSADTSKSSDEKVAIKDHPQYSKYFKMLKVGLPVDAVKAKMSQEGVIPDYIDKDPDSLIFLTEPKNGAEEGSASAVGGGDVAVSDHPKYGKYFRMLKVGLPREAIKAKMQHEGMNPAFLDKDPSEVIPIESPAAEDSGGGGGGSDVKVSVADHPTYAKYFKMMKVGLPKEAIKAKMQQEGVNPSFLDKDPTEMVSMVESKTAGGEGPSTRPKNPNAAAMSAIAGGISALGSKGVPKLRKKKLYWKALDASQVGRDSLWADKDDDITLDEAEFNQLFVESNDDQLKKPPGETAKAAAPSTSRKRVNLIDMKRGQNAGIALARIKMSFAEVKERISLMDDEIFTTDQLRSLSDYLPSAEEAALIKAFRGDPEMLGQAEKYMKVMTGFSSAAKRIQVMIYKQQFKSRVGECGDTLNAIESACDDVKMSVRLKKVLKTILKVGNQMNDGEDHLGFTLDSLLKLQSAKAFDKKTSILQYVIMLIYRNDEKCLAFPDELSHCAEASRLTLDSAQQEQMALRQGLEASLRVITEIKAEDQAKQVQSSSTAMAFFLVKARQSLEELDLKIENVRNKFSNVLAYFGEEAAMASQDFFSTLTKFVQEFIAARDNLERARRVEQKKVAREKEQKERQRIKEKETAAREASGL